MLYLVGQILAFVLVAMVLGAALAWIFLIGPMRRQRATSGTAVTAAAEPVVDRAATDGEPVSRPGRVGLADFDEDRLGALTDWLRRQEERSVAENAELVTRLAAAEQQVGESENRVSAAERQVATAVEQVGATQARIAQIEAELRGAAAEEQGRETRRLRTALAEAEARAARFSARLEIVRTEAEHAAHQVATVTERLDRRQAEWAAERASLLVRIAEADSIAAASSARHESSGVSTDARQDSTPVEESSAADSTVALPAAADPAAVLAEPAPTVTDDLDARSEPVNEAGVRGAADEIAVADSTAVDGTDLFATTTTGRVVALGGSRGQARPSGAGRPVQARQRAAVAALVPAGGASPAADGGDDRVEPPAVDTATLDAVVQEILDADADARAVPEPESVPPAAVTSAADDEPRAVSVLEAAAAETGELVLPSWGGLAEPVPSNDNLKEIVGIGPVIETRLRALGVTSFRQLAVMGDTDVDRLSARLDGFGSRILSDDWVGQARELSARGDGDLDHR